MTPDLDKFHSETLSIEERYKQLEETNEWLVELKKWQEANAKKEICFNCNNYCAIKVEEGSCSRFGTTVLRDATCDKWKAISKK